MNFIFKISSLTLMISLLSVSTYSQEIKKNSVYLEIGGNSILYSINYDRLITLSEKLRFAPRIGISWYGKDRFTTPLEANLMWGKNKKSKNFAEIGVGTTLVSKKYEEINDFEINNKNNVEKGINALLTLRAGYRHQKTQGGLMYRFGFLLLYNSYSTGNKILPYGGLSLGYTF